MAKYGKKAQDTVESAMHRRKKGNAQELIGSEGQEQEQAIAIGLSEARAKGSQGAGAQRRRQQEAIAFWILMCLHFSIWVMSGR